MTRAEATFLVEIGVLPDDAEGRDDRPKRAAIAGPAH